jgi:hypothetical protein
MAFKECIRGSEVSKKDRHKEISRECHPSIKQIYNKPSYD